MIEIRHLCKTFHTGGTPVPALTDVSLTVNDGEIFGIIGLSGAGKSTLLKSIIGFLRYRGEIRVNGLLNKSVEAKKLVGYVPEIPSLYPNLTVSEHMEFLARAYRLTDYKAHAEELLSRFELDDKKKKFGDELSKGMQQKLNLCLGLLPRPQLLLMDEPMIGLDPHAIKELKKVMEEMRAEGRTVLLSTHMIDSVDMLWDRTLIMQGGELRADVTKAQLDANGERLEELFFAITEGAAAPDGE